MGLPTPWLIGLVLLCFALAAIPTRRLSDAGIRLRRGRRPPKQVGSGSGRDVDRDDHPAPPS